MTTKTLKAPLVAFYTASARITHAWHHAARHNLALGRLAHFQDLHPAGESLATDEGTEELPRVVLSHADDDPRAMVELGINPVVSGAFHLLFTGPGTHPDQIAQWMRSTNIRSESRLHVIEIDDLQAPRISELLGRVCFALGRERSRDGIIDAYLAGDVLYVRGPKYRMLHVPLNSVTDLRGQPQAVLRNFSIDPDGSFLQWPDLDVHLGWNQFLQAVEPAELRKAQQRDADFNTRYGAAIRRFRESSGILQTQVSGLTDRQLRRIEQGRSRATTSAITALATAHKLDVNTYMETLAKSMR